MADTLGPRERREIATEVFRIFCLHTDRVVITYERDYLTIRVPFREEADYNSDAAVLVGVARNVNEYEETEVQAREKKE